ncbi:MAG TPA: potassium channel family protein [Miltoncostaeaceae bacterium]|nr:potassium channel family protein [Miltoncostaeaceae bacterium]
MPSVQRIVDRVVERIVRSPFKGAWAATAIVTGSVTVVAGVLIRLTDPDTFGNVWSGMWWSVQTVTTVGYGDKVPQSAVGRTIAALTMLIGIGFISVTTAAIASAFIEAARRRRAAEAGKDPMLGDVERLTAQVEALTAEVRALRGAGAEDPGGA